MKTLRTALATLGIIVLPFVVTPSTNAGQSAHIVKAVGDNYFPADSVVVGSPLLTPIPQSIQRDIWIGEAADRFANKNKSASQLRYQLHCLANKESKHGEYQTCGDSGKSCGLYQYREATWSYFRKLMLAKGLIASVSTRWNEKEAIATTAWALANNKELNWGPIKNKGNCL